MRNSKSPRGNRKGIKKKSGMNRNAISPKSRRGKKRGRTKFQERVTNNASPNRKRGFTESFTAKPDNEEGTDNIQNDVDNIQNYVDNIQNDVDNIQNDVDNIQNDVQGDSLDFPKENGPPFEDISYIILDETVNTPNTSLNLVDSSKAPSASSSPTEGVKTVLVDLQKQDDSQVKNASNRMPSRWRHFNKWKEAKRRKIEETQKVIECITIDSDSENIDDGNTITLSDDEVQIIDSSALPDFIPIPKQVLEIGKEKKKKKSLTVEDMGALRPIVIDGANVAFGHSRQKKVFSSEGLRICTDYFTTRGHKVYVFIPQFRRLHHLTTDTKVLDKMEEEGLIYYTPSRRIDGRLIASYDDRFIVEFATKKGAIIVTRDNYRDLLKTASNDEWKETIKNRLLLYTFVDDMIMFPDDPLGRNGPCLEVFLRFPKSEDSGESSKS